MIKRIPYLILGLVCFATLAFGQQPPTFTVSPQNLTVDPNDDLSLNITVDNYIDFITFQYTIRWDPTILEYQSVSNINGTAFPGFNSSGIGDTNAGSQGTLSVSWFESDLMPITVPNGTVVFTINFKAIGSGTTSVAFTEDPPGIEVIDENEENVGIIPRNATITVTGDITGGNNNPLGVSAPSLTAENGTTVCVPIRVSNFNQVNGFQFSINYNPAVLTYNSLQNFGLAGLDATDFMVPPSTNPGQITVNWSNPAGVTLANNTRIVEVCFTVIGNAPASSAISFTGTPAAINVTTLASNGMNVGITPSNGTVAVINGGNGGELILTAGSGNGTPGSEVCIPVTASNFDEIVSFQFSMSYNPAVLSFNGARNFNLTDLDASAFGNATPGRISVSWSDNSTNGITLPDNTVIFELCFSLVNGGSSPIGFLGMPTAIEVTTVESDGADIGLIGNAGQIVSEGEVTIDGFTFIAESETIQPGDDFCVDVSVNDFIDIISFQYSMTWDPTVIQFTGVQGFNLAELEASNFGMSGVANGTLTISWLDNTTQGVTVPNGNPPPAIFQVCFRAIGNLGQSTGFTFGSSPTNLEVIDNQENELVPDLINGIITLGAPSMGNVNLTLTPPAQAVAIGNNFCMPLSVMNFNNITNMQTTINYPSNLLQFTQAQLSGTLPGLMNSQINSSTPGRIIINWTAPNGSATLANGTIILNLCFTVLQAGPNNSATISFSNSSINNTDGDNLTLVAPSVNVPLGNPPVIFPIAAATVCASPGETICVPVSVFNFDDLISMQHSIMFNASLLQFQSVNILGTLTDLEQSSFNINNANNGEITCSWLRNNLACTTLPDNTTIYELCFTVLGNAGQSSAIAFTNVPTAFEVVNCMEEELPWMGQNGSVNIEANCDVPCDVVETVTDVTCNGQNNGSISITLIGGCTGTFAWSNGGPNSPTITGLAPGTYTVTVTANGQQYIETYQVNQPTAVTINSATPTGATCFGNANGRINLSVSGGTGAYTYNFSPGNATTNPAMGLSQGTYAVTVTDANGCTATRGDIVVGGPAAALSVTASNVTNVVCGGESTGAITVAATGGTGAYTYNWGNGITGTTRSNLPAGTYTVTVTDANNCTDTETITVANTNPAIVISNVVVTQLTGAGNNGAINVNVAGGTGQFNYNWAGPNFTAMTQDINNLNNPGTYTLTVTDNMNNCTATTTATLNAALNINGGAAAVVTNTCFGQTNGSINISPTGGSGTYNYSWSPGGATTQDVSGLGAGMYTVTVTDANNPSVNATATFTVMAVSEIVVTPVIVNDTGIGNGSIDLSVSGGSGTNNFTYSWSPGGDTTEDLFDKTAGTYNVTITDTNSGCTMVRTFIIPLSSISLGLASITPQGVSCNGASDGEVSLRIEGGSPNYTITFTPAIDGQPFFDNGAELQTYTGFSGGPVTVNVTDAGGATITQEVIIPEPAPIVLDDATHIFDAINTVNCDGAIDLEISGGVADYTFAWSSSNGQTVAAVENPGQLCPGVYNVTVTDDNDCVEVFTDFVVKQFTIQTNQTSLTNPSCPDSGNGSIALSVINGAMPYTITWTNTSTGTIVGTGPTLSGVVEGTYTATVRDADGRTISQDFTLTANSTLTATTTIESNYNGFGVSCADSQNGIIRVIPNGSGTYNYVWSSNLGTSAIVTNAPSGLHTVTVTEVGSGCSTQATVTVTAPQAINIDLNVENISCSGEEDGEIVAFASGGVGGLNYRWDDNFNGSARFNLEADTYVLRVRDLNSCEEVSTIVISNPLELVIALTANPITDTDSGTASVIVAGGTEPYSYEWRNDGTIISASQTVEGITKEGRYVVVVTDAHGCSEVGFVDVPLLANCLKSRPVITPQEDGGDGLNDNFIINCIENYPGNRLEIYNRWGQLVFEGDNYDNTWEGKNRRGQPLPEGGYFYVLSYKDASGQLTQLKGSLSILRE